LVDYQKKTRGTSGSSQALLPACHTSQHVTHEFLV